MSLTDDQVKLLADWYCGANKIACFDPAIREV